MKRPYIPRLVVAGLSGDSGKTLVSLSLILGARARGVPVAAFKKGPDYIDAAWLSWAASAPARNLDTFLSGDSLVGQAFSRHAVRCGRAGTCGLNLVEGNRGLFDGMDAAGTHSTAALAKLLRAPVLLVLDVRKLTGTAAALVRGCQAIDPGLLVAGVVLNRVAGTRHEAVAREAIERYCGVPVLGAVPCLDQSTLIPGRHLGLITPRELESIDRAADALERVSRDHLDLARILAAASAAAVADEFEPPTSLPAAASAARPPVTVGYLSDSAFSFYYPENLEALDAEGATLVPISSLSPGGLPAGLDALYIGGGFPETHAAALERNRALLDSLGRAAAAGLPIYAECGGLMLLARTMTWQGRRHAMAGVLPVDVEVLPRPQGHGYSVLSVDRPNPFFAIGLEIRGHEFHYSRVAGPLPDTACAVRRGTGCGPSNRPAGAGPVGNRDAIVVNQVWASYTHVHASALPEWAQGIVRAARRRHGTS